MAGFQGGRGLDHADVASENTEQPGTAGHGHNRAGGQRFSRTREDDRGLEKEEGEESEQGGSTALIDGVRKFAMDVRELDIDLIDSINPFGEAYAILAKTMSEESLKAVATIIAGRRTALTPDDAKDLATRAYRFKKEHGRLPSATSADAWERRMAEGAAAFVRFKKEGRYD